MDRPLEKKKWNNKRILTLVGITGLVGLIAASFYFTSGNSKLNVEADRISIVEIKKDNFQEFIPINGSVLPISSIYLDASVGGRVVTVIDRNMLCIGLSDLRLCQEV